MNCEYLWAFNTHIWKPTKRQLLLMLSSVCHEEIERINQFRFKDDFKLCLAGRIMIRKCIQQVTNIKWDEIVLTRTAKGKPELGNRLTAGKNLYFNISHQGDYTVLAASTKSNIGIDIMKYVKPNRTDIPSFFNLMKRQFVDAEWKFILANDTEWRQLQAFYRLWCLKESYVKAIGTGIGTNSADYMSFNVSENGWKEIEKMKVFHESELFINSKKQPWKFHEYQIDKNHIAAVAVDDGGKLDSSIMVPFKFLTVENLFEDAMEICKSDETWWTNYEQKEEKKF